MSIRLPSDEELATGIDAEDTIEFLFDIFLVLYGATSHCMFSRWVFFHHLYAAGQLKKKVKDHTSSVTSFK